MLPASPAEDHGAVRINLHIVERPLPTRGRGTVGRMAHMKQVVHACTLNVLCSVCVIFANKHLYGPRLGFRFGTALTVCHFVFSFATCVLLCATGYVKFKRLPVLRVLPISLAFSGYVAFNNLSLLHNSVCVYQLAKIACTPAIVIIERVYYRKQKSRAVIASLFPTCLGVAIAVYSDPEVSAAGLWWATLAVAANSLYTIWGQTEQKALGAEPLQLLLYQAPLSAVLLACLTPFFDDTAQLWQYEWDTSRTLALLLTCGLAFGVNFSFFLGVGKTSPLTMNLLGHFKTLLVFGGGVLLFSEALTLKKVAGGALTLVGLVMYGNARLAETQKKRIAII